MAASSSWTRAPMARHSWEIGELQPHPRLLTPTRFLPMSGHVSICRCCRAYTVL